MGIIRDDLDPREAADRLRNWFLERLTVSPGVRGPFADLACNLITWALEDVNRGVDWEEVVEALRRGTP
jgi:hypothetical protein